MKPITLRAPSAVASGLGAIVIVQLLAFASAWRSLHVLTRSVDMPPPAHLGGRNKVGDASLAARIIGAHLFGLPPSAPAGNDNGGAKADSTLYSLKGTVTLGSSGEGFAIIATADGRSHLYRDGQALSERVLLQRVTRDYIVLLDDAKPERLTLPHGTLGILLASRASATGAAPAEATATLTADTRATLTTFGLSVVPDFSGGVAGLSGQGAPSWQHSGLLSTDVIVAIDGTPVDRVLQTPSAIDNAAVAAVTTLTVLRDGARMEIEAVPETPQISRPPRHRS
jgi:Type II secretion system protein C